VPKIKGGDVLSPQHKTIGVSRLDPEVTWVALLGTDVAVIPIETDGQESLKQISFLEPPWEELVDAYASTAAFEALAPGADDFAVKLRGVVYTARS
jgi:hypothetical protein